MEKITMHEFETLKKGRKVRVETQEESYGLTLLNITRVYKKKLFKEEECIACAHDGMYWKA